ncbi:MAG: hypothetical protein LBB34_01555 [Holosporales bacterium]|jgi:lysozyme family protein|nr:hypothetical protein [Holosporales bacterium]
MKEGIYIDDENDSRGATKFGISLRFLKGLDIKEGDINDDNKISEEDIKDLDEEKAKLENLTFKADQVRIQARAELQ